MAVSVKNAYLKTHKSKQEEEEHRRRRSKEVVRLRKARKSGILEEVRQLPSSFELSFGIEEEICKEVLSITRKVQSMFNQTDSVDGPEGPQSQERKLRIILKELHDLVEDNRVEENINCLLALITAKNVQSCITSELMNALRNSGLVTIMIEILHLLSSNSQKPEGITSFLATVLLSTLTEDSLLSSQDVKKLHFSLTHILASQDSNPTLIVESLECLACLLKKYEIHQDCVLLSLEAIFKHFERMKNVEDSIWLATIVWCCRFLLEELSCDSQRKLEFTIYVDWFTKLRGCLSVSDVTIQINLQWALVHLLHCADKAKDIDVTEIILNPELLVNVYGFVQQSDTINEGWVKLVARIVSCRPKLSKQLVDLGFLTILPSFLESQMNVQADCVVCLNRICQLGYEYIQRILDNNSILPLVVDLLCLGDFETQKEVTCFFSHLSKECNLQQIRFLQTQNVISALSIQLTVKDTDVLRNALTTYRWILCKARENGLENDIRHMFQQNTLSDLEKLSYHDNKFISDVASAILDTYLTDADDTYDAAVLQNRSYSISQVPVSLSGSFEF